MPTQDQILSDSLKHYLSAARSATELSNELEIRVQWAKNALASLNSYGSPTHQATARKRVADLAVDLIKVNLEMIALVAEPASSPAGRLNYVRQLLDPQLPNAQLAPNTSALTTMPAAAAAPSPAHTAAGTAAVVSGLKQAAQQALSKLAPAGSAPAPQSAWPFATNKLKDSLAGAGILPASKSTASATPAKAYDTEARTVYVNIRKHPKGFTQPTGKRKVRRLERNADGTISIGIGKDGSQGWTVGQGADISFLDFHLAHEKGTKVSLNGAIKYLESGVIDTRA